MKQFERFLEVDSELRFRVWQGLVAGCGAGNLDFPTRTQQNPHMAHEFSTSFLQDSIKVFQYYKRLADRAMEQIPENALFASLDEESNSIAIIVKHVAGNMRSRWTDFLRSDGEKPDRNRDSEFEATQDTRGGLFSLWDLGWKLAVEALNSLTDADLNRTIYIRGEAHSLMQAINRNLTHTAYHVGQIVYLAKHFTGAKWNTLTVPRGKSAEFTAKLTSGKAL